MGEPAGLEQLARIRKMQEQYEGSKPSGLDDLIRVFGQAGQYKGLSGLAPAYTANQQQKRSQDLAMAERVNQLMGGVETTQRGEMKDIATGALTGLGTDRATAATRDKDLMSILSQGRGQDVTAATAEKQRKTQERGQDIQLKVAAIQAAATREARAQGADDKTIAAAEAAFARDPEAKALSKALEMLANNPTNPRYQTTLQKLQAIQASKYQQFGITLQAAPGAASPGGTTRMKFDANGNPIK
jgi:Skp family chaperone for outer membrane proteins